MSDAESKDVEILEHEGWLEVRFLGTYQLAKFKKQIDQAADACLARSVGRILIDISRVSAFQNAGTLDRFEIGMYGAQVAKRFRVAMFGVEEQMDPEQFGVRVARNRGVNVQVFTKKDAALIWLNSPDPA